MFDDWHPAWCSPNRCDATDPALPAYGGAHRSEPQPVDMKLLSVGYGPVQVASVWLYAAAAPWKVATYLVALVDGVEISMPISQAVGVLTQLTQLAAQDQPNR